jgi:NAD(P)-dependent dehydrogenase (short-subunit alcohol dehydrogenase family)
VLSVTSVAGFNGYPGSGYYAASKHAVEGWSDALAAELGPLGIKVTCVAPGPFRTDWAGRSLRQTPNRIADYAGTAGVRMRNTAGNSGTQAGDPVRAAEVMVRITETDPAPRHVVLGAWGIDAVVDRLEAIRAEVEAWREIGAATDFPKR